MEDYGRLIGRLIAQYQKHVLNLLSSLVSFQLIEPKKIKKGAASGSFRYGFSVILAVPAVVQMSVELQTNSVCII